MEYIFMRVTIGKFTNDKTETIKIEDAINQNKIYDTADKLCIFDGDNYVDVEDFDIKYLQIKTNKYGVILPGQKVSLDQSYALKAKTIEKKDISLLQAINIKKSYTKYLGKVRR